MRRRCSGGSGSFIFTSLKTAWANRPLVRRLARGAWWSLAANGISRGLTLIASFIIARLIGREEFGALGIIQSTVGTFQVLAGLALGVTATRFLALYRIADPARAGRILVLTQVFALGTGLLAAVGLVTGSGWLATHTLARPELAVHLRVGGILLLLWSAGSAQTGILTGFEAFRAQAIANLISGTLSFPFVIVGGLWGGLAGIIWGLVAGAVASVSINQWFIIREARAAGIPLSLAGWHREWRVIPDFSLPAYLSGAMLWPATWLCNTILVNQPGGYSHMGLFNAANQWRAAVLFVPGVFAGMILPVLATLHGAQDNRRIQRTITISIAVNTLLVTLPALVIMLIAPHAMSLYGPPFKSGATTLILLLATALLNPAITVFLTAICSAGRMWHGFCLTLFWASVTLACAWVLIPRYQATGLALANLLASALYLPVLAIYHWRTKGWLAPATAIPPDSEQHV